jgi:flagellar hook-basal body complex protein FliE
MDVTLTPGMLQAVRNALAAGATVPPGGAPAAGGADFSAALGDALKAVSQAQEESSTLQRRFQSGAEGVSLEETMVAMQKAQIGFQAALAVRNRLVSAYSDIMNMPV